VIITNTLWQFFSLLCAKVNSAFYPERDGKRVSVLRAPKSKFSVRQLFAGAGNG